MAPFGSIAGWALLSRRDAASESRSTSKNRKKNIEPNENMTDANKKTDTRENAPRQGSALALNGVSDHS